MADDGTLRANSLRSWLQVAVGLGLVAVSWWLFRERFSRSPAPIDPRLVVAFVCLWTGFPVVMVGLEQLLRIRFELLALDTTRRELVLRIIVLNMLSVACYVGFTLAGEPENVALRAGLLVPPAAAFLMINYYSLRSRKPE